MQNLKKNNSLKTLNVPDRIIIKLSVKQQAGGVWIGFIWLKTGQ
jgi:hypothetical protein